MPYETRDGDGALFRNDAKKDDTSPDYQGRIRVAGVEYWISGWAKTSKAGERYLSLAARPKESSTSTTAKPATRAWRDNSGF